MKKLKNLLYPSRCNGKKWIILLLVIGIFCQSMFVLYPYLVNKLLTVIETKASVDQFYTRSWVLLAGTITMILLDRCQWLLSDYLWPVLYTRRKIDYAHKFVALDYTTVNDLGTGKSIARLEKGTTAEIDIVQSRINLFINTFFRGTIVIIILFYFEPMLVLVMFITFAIVVAVDRVFYRYLKPLTKRNTEFHEEASRQTVKIVMEHSLISMKNMQQKEVESHKNHMFQRPPMEAKMSFLQYTPMDIIFLGIKLVEWGIYFRLGRQVYQGESSFAYMVMIVGYIMAFWRPLENALHQFARINRQTDSYEKLVEYINKPVTVKDGDNDFAYKKGSISFDNVSFGYHENKGIFSGLSLEIPGGKTTAFVGHSGSGKSTLIKLILRFYDPSNGAILVDNQDLTSLTKRSYYSHIGFVSQDPSVFDGTIYENMTYGLEDTTDIDERIDKIIKDSHCEFIHNLDKGLNSHIGEKGVKLSGGERQRLAIARLMLNNPEIIVLDEPTSALDSISEDKITSALKSLTRNKTVIVIAHRLQTVQHADKIIVMDKGSISQEGTHEELLKSGGIYKSLVDLQHGKVGG